MGKRITQRARGKGSLTFRVRRKGYKHKISYPSLSFEGIGKIINLINSSGHSAPLMEIEINERNKKNRFIIPAADGVHEGKEVYICRLREGGNYEKGDILRLKDIKQGEKIFNIENVPGGGGKILRSGGTSGFIGVKDEKGVEIIIKRRKIILNKECRAVIGIVAGEGRKLKPFVKAGKKYHLMKSKGRKWHRTSAVKVNAVDHPFGGGRGKRIKSKIAKRNSPPGLKVGHIRPRKTGKRK
jgi:large subunit ribosomal protein L2